MAGPCEAPAGQSRTSVFLHGSYSIPDRWSAASGLGLGTSPWSIGAPNFDHPVGSCQQSMSSSKSQRHSKPLAVTAVPRAVLWIDWDSVDLIIYSTKNLPKVLSLYYCHLECPFFYQTSFFFKSQVPIGDIQTGQSGFASHEFAQQLWIQKTSEWLKIGKSNYP